MNLTTRSKVNLWCIQAKITQAAQKIEKKKKWIQHWTWRAFSAVFMVTSISSARVDSNQFPSLRREIQFAWRKKKLLKERIQFSTKSIVNFIAAAHFLCNKYNIFSLKLFDVVEGYENEISFNFHLNKKIRKHSNVIQLRDNFLHWDLNFILLSWKLFCPSKRPKNFHQFLPLYSHLQDAQFFIFYAFY